MSFFFLSLSVDWSLVLSGLATIGIPTALLLYSVKRMRDLAGPSVELEPQHLVTIVRAFPTTGFSLQSLETLVRRADFRSPETRRAELRSLENWLADRNTAGGDGFSVVRRDPRDHQGPAAERLASTLIKRLETPGTAHPSDSENSDDSIWCVLGMVAAVAVSAADTIPEGDGAEIAAQAQDALKAATEAAVAMDAFYLFFAPAPGEPLSAEGAQRLLHDLKALQSAA